MREIIEFRADEKDARKHLGRDVGKTLGGSVRKIEIDSADPLFRAICEIERREPFVLSWSIRRRYTKRELEAAQLIHLQITAVFEPEGEAVGTLYDYSSTCPHCGAGRRQVSDLVLDLRRVPRRADIARTIADEWIVSQRLAAIFVDEAITGVELRPVRHRAHLDDEGFDLGSVPSGRKLLARAEDAGVELGSWEFWVWLNRDEQDELFARAEDEYRVGRRGSESRRSARFSPWYQLVVTSRPVPVAPETRFGVTPCDGHDSDKYRCPLGHVAGLNLLSELHVSREGWDESDVACTHELVGLRQGVLVPAPLLLISPRLRAILEANDVRGYRVEITHSR